MRKPLPLYSKTMRKYVVQTNIGLLRRDIAQSKAHIARQKAQLEVLLDGVAGSGDVTLKPTDVFTHDKGRDGTIDDPHEWERLLQHFVDLGADDVEDLVHTLRCRRNVSEYCREKGIPLPSGYS